MMLRIVVSFLFLLTAVFQGCAGPGRLPAVPLELQGKVVVSGLGEVRYRPAQDLQMIVEEGKDSIRRELADRKARGLSGPMPPSYFLAVSGGAAANRLLRRRLVTWAEETGIDLRLVPLCYSGDNAAMIAHAALLRHRRGRSDDPTTARAASRVPM